MPAGDLQTKHHLNVLVDSGTVQALTTSWPIMWSDLKAVVAKVDSRQLTAQTLWSYQYLRHELREAQSPYNFEYHAYASNAPLAIGDFGSDAREQFQATVASSFTRERLSVKLSASYAREPMDDRDLRADGSYAAYLLGNWALGFGAIDRWWGPGWESSLILSNNARPIPGLFLQRRSATPFTSKWLSWIGPWQMTTFMGETEQNRHIADARLWGMRLNFRPLKSLEIGLSRTAMWGGDNRPGDIDTFVKLLLGQDNRREGEDGSQEPGNQLAGFDARWGFQLGAYSSAIYAQLIGEDEAGGLPSRHIGMGGIETSSLWFGAQVRLSLEGQNTAVYFYDNNSPETPTVTDSVKPLYNTAYEHALYKTGYRYLGRPIGAATDNDSESYTLRGQVYFDNGHYANASLAHHRINTDGTGGPGGKAGGNVFGASQLTDDVLSFEYNVPMSNHHKITLGLFRHSTPLYLGQDKIDNGGYLSLHGKW